MRIEYVRGGLIEESHDGILVKYGDLDSSLEPYYLRSCAKPLQATLLLDYEANLKEEELALCCGSHAGEKCHIDIARQIMYKYDLEAHMLTCGIHIPLSRSMQDKMFLYEEKPSALHNNCSGKHIGFLVCCRINGWDLETYYMPEHPLQKAIKSRICDLCETSSDYPVTIDGCGVPIMSMPLHNMLVGYLNLLKYEKIINAISHYPYIFGGEDRLDTEIIQKTDGIIAKVGAGGLCIVVNIAKKDAFVIKINDCSMEARKIATLDTINRLGWGKIEYNHKIQTLHGDVVGEIIIK